MPIYDRQCGNLHQKLDLYEQIRKEEYPCEVCGEPLKRVLLPTRTGAVIADEIPGGIWIRHGLCNEDGSPRKYYSHSEMRKEAERRGLVNRVEHTPIPGSDHSPHTTSWSTPPAILTPEDEQERLQNWYAHEALLQTSKRRS